MNLIKRIARGLYFRFSNIINMGSYYFSIMLPAKNVIIFESLPDYTDNSYYLYKYLSKLNSPKYNLEWMITDSSKASPLYITHHTIGLHPVSFSKIARARFVFFSHYYPNFRLKKKQQTVVYMTHGCPMKKAKSKSVKNPDKDYTRKANFDYALCIGEGAIVPESIFCLTTPDRILPLGYPRNDELVKASKQPRIDLEIIDIGTDKTIIWMPTFRQSDIESLSEKSSQNASGLPLINGYDDLVDLNRECIKHNVSIVIKIHRLQAHFPIFNCEYSNIKFINDDWLDKHNLRLYELLGHMDALVTDYSSVYFDFLLLDRPVAFILDDLHEYEADRGFVFDDVKSIMAGKHIYELADLKDFISDVSQDIDDCKDSRAAICGKFHNDGHSTSCERICRYFKLI